MPNAAQLACLNACLNASAALCLLAGFVSIKTGHRLRHRNFMLSAFAISVVFLISYLTRNLLYGDTPFQGQGVIRAIYFTILISHIALAIATVPLVLRTLFLAQQNRFVAHKRIAKVTFPIWLYVSITGVVVYLMLY